MRWRGIERFCGYARVLVNKAPQPPFYFHASPPMKMWDGCGPQLPPLDKNQPKSALLREIHQLAQTDMERALGRLVHCTDAEFDQIIEAQVKLSRWASLNLMHHPDQLPSQVPRALRLSRMRYGLPWWLIEASYRRQRFDEEMKK